MKKIISLLILSLILVGCSQDEVEVDEPNVVVKGEQGNYNYVLPFDSNHLRFARPGEDYKEIGEGLIKISKDYFPITKHNLKEGSIISDFRNDYQPLVFLRESQDNPVGLNPSSTTKVKVNKDKEVSGPIFVSDLFEVDFVSKKDDDKLLGASFALVVNKTILDEDKIQVVVDDEVLYDFATKIAAPKLESYLRKKPELSGIPIVIAIYEVDSSNESIPGRFIAKAEYVKRQGQFEKVNHKWALFPSSIGRSVDVVMNEQITSMKRSIMGFIPEDIGVIAYGEYYDDKNW